MISQVQEAEMIAAGIKRSNESLSEELQMSKEALMRMENLVGVFVAVLEDKFIGTKL